MKNFRQKLKLWYKRYRRKLIQVYAALLYNANFKGYFTGRIYSGSSKYACVPGLNCYSCPGAVGACPLGALQNALASSGARAPFLMLGIVMLFGLLLGRTICGYLCPVGLGQELLYKIKTPKLKKSRYTRVLSYLKYVILIVFAVAVPLMYGLSGATPVPAFCKYICPAGTFGGGVGLLSNPANADQFDMLGPLFTWKFALMAAIVVSCIFIFRAFCRFICPLGAIYGFFNKISLIGVKLDKNTCTDCGLCLAHCKMDIKRVGDHECINCGECIDVCPAKAIRWKGTGFKLHKNAVDGEAAPSEERPLGALVGGIATAETVNALALENTVPETAEEARAAAPQKTVTEEPLPMAAAPAAARAKKPTSFWIQLFAWIAALALLIGAVVYYNFIDVSARPNEGTEVGELFPDFSAHTQDDRHFTLTDGFGERATVLVFREHNAESDGLIDNIHTAYGAFDARYSGYGFASKMKIYAIGAAELGKDTEYITSHGWGEYPITFLQDGTTDGAFEKLAVHSGEESELTLPATFVLNGEGMIVAKLTGAETAEALTDILETPYRGSSVGDICPDFRLKTYGFDESGEYTLLEETFTLSAYRGQVVVINFWATWCGPCIAEIPHFNRTQEENPDITVVAVQGIADVDDVPWFIYNTKGWSNYALTFLQDTVSGDVSETFVLLGGKDSWPITLIVNADGIVSFTRQGSLSYEKLSEEVQNAKA